MQPTHVKWEDITPQSGDSSSHGLTNGVAQLTNGVSHVNINGAVAKAVPRTIFAPVAEVIPRNYLVIDTKFVSPPMAGLGIPGPDGDVLDVGPNGLPSVSDDILAELPPDCRKALEEAKAKELQWKRQWGTEAESGARGNLKIGFLGFPV